MFGRTPFAFNGTEVLRVICIIVNQILWGEFDHGGERAPRSIDLFYIVMHQNVLVEILVGMVIVAENLRVSDHDFTSNDDPRLPVLAIFPGHPNFRDPLVLIIQFRVCFGIT